jgi:glycosyltransferase involved in cell wall biosynthesis
MLMLLMESLHNSKMKFSLAIFFILQMTLYSFGRDTEQQVDLKFVSFGRDPIQKSPSVLLVRSIKHWGGIACHTFALYKELLLLNSNVRILVPRGSKIEIELARAKLPYYVYSSKRKSKKRSSSRFDQTSLFQAISRICSERRIDIIHVNKPKEFKIAQRISKIFNVAVIVQHHVFSEPNYLKKSSKIDAFLSTCPDVVRKIQDKNEKLKCGVNLIKFVPPMTFDTRFLNFVPLYPDKQTFFKTAFAIDIGKMPVVCMVAHLNQCKNHELLLRAAHLLIKLHNTPFHIVLAGSDSDCPGREAQLKALVEELDLQQFVHFLGFVDDIPELLYYSDIKVLPSKGEAFAIAVFEAAFMKKPIILSNAAGSADHIIFHEKTGLLFDPSDVEQLAFCIKRLIEDEKFAAWLGHNAYSLAINEFSDIAIARKYASIYKKVYQGKVG